MNLFVFFAHYNLVYLIHVSFYIIIFQHVDHDCKKCTNCMYHNWKFLLLLWSLSFITYKNSEKLHQTALIFPIFIAYKVDINCSQKFPDPYVYMVHVNYSTLVNYILFTNKNFTDHSHGKVVSPPWGPPRLTPPATTSLSPQR